MWAAFTNAQDFPNVGHESLDDEHRSIIRLMNELYDSIVRKAAVTEQRRLLHELETYVRVNCRSEEEMMEADLFPNRQNHRKAHEAMYRKIHEYEKVLHGGKEDASIDGLRGLRELFSRHISQEDARVASWHRIQCISSDSPD